MPTHTFKDKQGQAWSVDVTLQLVADVQRHLDVDLRPDPDIGKRLIALAYDIETLVNILYRACKKQADERGIDDAAFGELFDGEAFDSATSALLEAYTSFCPALMRQGLLKQTAAQGRAEQMAMDRLDQELTDDKIKQMVNDAISGAMSKDSPDSSDATPTR